MNPFNNEQLASGVWLIIGVMVVVFSIPYKLGSLASPDTGFMPFLSGLAMCLFSLIGLVHGTLERKRGEGWKPVITDEIRWEKSLFILAALLAYVFLLKSLGFVLCTVLFLGFLFRAVKPQKWSTVILGSVLITTCAFVIFDVWLKSQLPKGPWGF
jgi:hypothetical protein